VIIYTLFSGKNNEALYLFVLSFVSVLITGILMITRNPYVPFDYGFEDCQFACVAIRIIDFLIIGFLIYYIIKLFMNTMNSYVDELSNKATILEQLNTALQHKVAEKNKNKELKSNLELKNKKLAINTLHLLKQTEFDVNLVKELKEIARTSKGTNKEKLLRLIQNTKINANAVIWSEFEKSFTEVNTSFYKKLKRDFPDLTPNEKKLCAFIKLNMNTKDIANLTNISPRGVESARYRLRKKIQLKHDANLYEFLERY
jgi:DNA-binding CsgD family transcriptional regulator/large-conductance mechanosensitive channel